LIDHLTVSALCCAIVAGPEEFAEGLALGVQSLFSHAIG